MLAHEQAYCVQQTEAIQHLHEELEQNELFRCFVAVCVQRMTIERSMC